VHNRRLGSYQLLLCLGYDQLGHPLQAKLEPVTCNEERWIGLLRDLV
jgi:hypothetical protein